MALADYREIDVVEDAVNGRVGVIEKQVGEKFIHTIHCGKWIGSRGTISGTPTVTIGNAGASAPTAVAAAPTNNSFNLTVDAGAVNWNTSGQSTITLVITFSNGEKLELILDYKITA
jgi:hypothetical protein